MANEQNSADRQAQKQPPCRGIEAKEPMVWRDRQQPLPDVAQLFNEPIKQAMGQPEKFSKECQGADEQE